MRKQHVVTSVVIAALLIGGAFGLTACGGKEQPAQDGSATEQQSESTSEQQNAGEQDEQAVIDAVQGVIDEYLLNPSDELKQQLAAKADKNFKQESPTFREDGALDGGVSLTDVGVDPMDVVNWMFKDLYLDEDADSSDDVTSQYKVEFKSDTEAVVSFMVVSNDWINLYNELDEKIDEMDAADITPSAVGDAVRAAMEECDAPAAERAFRSGATDAVLNDKATWLDFTDFSCVVKYENGAWKAEPTEQVPGQSNSFKEWWDVQFDDAFDFTD